QKQIKSKPTITSSTSSAFVAIPNTSAQSNKHKRVDKVGSSPSSPSMVASSSASDNKSSTFSIIACGFEYDYDYSFSSDEDNASVESTSSGKK
ncbi:hypothetical protein TYRP_014357, partial [Tyrophagus putrescentiae]